MWDVSFSCRIATQATEDPCRDFTDTGPSAAHSRIMRYSAATEWLGHVTDDYYDMPK